MIFYPTTAQAMINNKQVTDDRPFGQRRNTQPISGIAKGKVRMKK
jgi:hypothetical protein